MSRHHAGDGTTVPQSTDSAATLRVREKAIADQAELIRKRWLRSRFPSVRGVCEDVQVVAEFVTGVAVDAAPLRPALSDYDAYRTAIHAMREAMREVNASLEKIERSEPKDRGSAFRKLNEHADSLFNGLRDATAAVRDVVGQESGVDEAAREQAERLVDSTDDKLVARGSMTPEEARARRLVNAISRLLEKARRTTGGIGAESLGHAYDTYAKHERRVATALRWVVSLLSIAIAALALWFHRAVTEATLLLEVARLSATVPLGLLAVYLARESTRHRTAALRARELAIALHTVDTYIADSEPADGQALRQALGMRAFGAPPDPPAATPSDLDLLHALLANLTETVSVEVLDRLGLGGNGQKGGEAADTKPDGTKS